MNVKRPSPTGQGIIHITSFSLKTYRDDILEGYGGYMVPRHVLPIYSYLSSKCLRLAVPKHEMEEIHMTNDIFLEMIVGNIQHLHRPMVYQ